MPNLVGIGNSQVPTNAMLGGLAYQDSVGEIVINKIKAKTGDTASDIFVYDTSKDSDGGAWRHRTQNKSWYDEGVSATRGARKEFPAVAVIVGGANKTTIYDGDDPNLSMWMEFKSDGSGGDKIFNRPQYWNTSSVSALNGTVCLVNSTQSAESTLVLNFVNDSVRLYPISGYPTYGGDYTLGISGRSNSSGSFRTISQNIVGDETFDVAMTVLPNAPIDASTELPVPTIAVGTGHGVSVIKDDGTVVDLTYQESSNNQVPFLDIDSNGRIYWSTRKSGNNGVYFHEENLPASDTSAEPSVNITLYQAGVSYAVKPTLIKGLITDAIRTKDRTVIAISGDNYVDNKAHLNLYNTIGDVNSSGSVDNFEMVDISTDYNTGYLIGDIKGAFLSDTDDTDVNSSSNITSGWADASNWEYQANRISLTSNGSQISITHADGSGSYVYSYLPITVETYSDYYIEVEFGAYNSGDLEVVPGIYNSNNERINLHGVSGTKKSGYFTSGPYTTLYLLINHNSTTATTINNILVQKIIEKDRSVNQKGLQVFGTITKEPVATGAELVAYSGYSASNYLVVPVTTAPGTGDFSITAWIKPGTMGSGTGNYFHLFNIGTSSTGGQNSATGFTLKMATTGSGGYAPYFYNNDGGTSHGTYNTDNRIPLGVWSQLIGLRRDGRAYLYLNGELLITGSTWTTNLTDTYLSIFRAPQFNNEVGGDAKVALVRYSLSAPTEEQIKKMYNDEKCLFHENAKCTLHGTSTAVTGLAFDDTTNVLHVGTSAGRSEFQGLNRINNTTTAVTTAISVSNELVAEQ